VDGGTADVVVGIVTHRRPQSLAALLERLTTLRFGNGPAPRMGVVVVDNSPDLEGREVVARACADGSLSVDYVPLGAGNIATGRNEVLRASCALAPLVALIDDDELPDPDWLHHLLDAEERTAADVVVGPVMARYPQEAPTWLRQSPFHSVPGPAAAGWVDEGYTGNALVRSDMVGRLGLRFDETLGRSGGEDQLFFRQAKDRGARMYFEPAAVVHETVSPDRLSTGYLVRREFRMGGTLGLLDRSRPDWPPGRPVLRFVRAAWWAASGVTIVARSAFTCSRAGTVTGMMRIARAVGMLHGLVGLTYQLYGAPESSRTRRPVIALVAAEGPGYQRAGHSRHLEGFVTHYCGDGYDVVMVVPGARTGFLVRRAAKGGVTYCAPSLRKLGGWQVVTSPTAIVGHAAWALFRRLPLAAQRVVDKVRTALRRRRQVDHILGAWLTPATSAWVNRSLQRIHPDAVLFNTVFTVPDPLVLPSSVHLSAVISHDVVHERAQNFRAAGHRVHPADFSATHEAQRLSAVDTVIAIQWDDARALARLAPHAHVVVSPVVVEADSAPRDRTRPGRCLFVGSGSLHNVEAVTWFLQNCWPDISLRYQGAELHVVGTVCARLQATPDGVVLRGEVADLAEEYARAEVVVAPLRTGSGLKVKVVEALCHGAATVTTPVGAQGLGGLRPRPYVLAETVAQVVDEVVGLLVDRMARQRLESTALSAAPLFSAARAFEELDEHLAKAGIASPRPRTGESSCAPVQ
jgi:hypothetical protein